MRLRELDPWQADRCSWADVSSHPGGHGFGRRPAPCQRRLRPRPRRPRDPSPGARREGGQKGQRQSGDRTGAAAAGSGRPQRGPLAQGVHTARTRLLRAGVPSQSERQGWGLGQFKPSTDDDPPDKHFLPCQLTGLASPGGCQAPAAGEKSPIIPAFVERRTGSDSRAACE